MTLRARTTRPTSRRTRLRRLFEGEERQQAVVTALFALVIAAVVLILLAVVGLAWYRDNVQPLARVGSLEVGPQLLRDRVELEQWRINLQSNRLAQANIDREIDAETLAARQSELDQRANALTTTALDDLIDVIYQSQLASAEGVTVSDADVDTRFAEEFAGVERRHVLVVVVEPIAAEGEEASPTIAERRIALERAGAALAAVQSGREWADVAREFSTDESAQIGGDLGFSSEVAVSDASLGNELFNLAAGGTTGVVRGTDGVYRIGRVTEIRSATEQPGLRDELTKLVSEPALRDMLHKEIAAERLKAKITDAALAETPEQARIAIIYIAGLYTDDPIDAEGEIKYSEIVFAPNHNLEVAPELPAEDAAWEKARVDAQQTYDELKALTAGEIRLERFRAIATEKSDSPTSEDGGLVDFTTRGLLPEAVGDALFAETHTAGDLIGLIRGDAAWYVLLFEERRDSPEQRVQAVQDLLAQPGADFAAIAKEHSEGPEAEEGGEVGWVTTDQLAPELADDVFALPAGGITEPLELGEGHYIIKVEEKATRPLDADQIPDVKAVAFDDWYTPKKDQAKKDGVIVIAGETPETEEDLVPGGD
ncbi:MAG: peptidylprolyl isomerase [Chloroflexota bacterium]